MVRTRVWDLPTRLFHWALVACIVGLAVTGTVGGNAMVWHFRFGYCVATLLLFRIVWGFVGGHWSRFSAFTYAPASVVAYVRGKRQPEHSVGHSPLGSVSVFAMLAVLAAQLATGLVSDDEIAFSGPLTRFVSNATATLATNYHAHVGKWLLLALVVLHVIAIAVYQHRKHKLLGAMIHGDKDLSVRSPASRDDARARLVALAVLAACAAGVYWITTLAATGF